MSENISTADYVLWAYRLLLGREPENIEAVRSWPESERREILAAFLSSAEYRNQQVASASWTAGNPAWFLAEVENGTRFWVRADDTLVSREVALASYKPAETAFVRRQLKRGMNVLDIGATIGWFSVNMAMLVGPEGRVDAFEPRDELARYLRRTVAENRLGNIVVHRLALGRANATGIMTFDENKPPGSTHLMIGDDPPPGEATQPVPLRRLDSIVWGGVDFIKIDVSGAERLVFDGAEIVLNRDRPLILSEINEALLQRTSRMSVPDYLSYFKEIDYEVRKLMPNGRCGEPASYEDVAETGGSIGVACVPAEKSQQILLR
jgi:FkbM family methyltransferase